MKTLISTIVLSVFFVLSMNVQAEGAMIYKDDLCIGTIYLDGFGPLKLRGDQLRANEVSAGADEFPGAGKWTCHGYYDQLLEFENAVVARGLCGVAGPDGNVLVTEDGLVVLTPSGNWTAQCKFHRSK